MDEDGVSLGSWLARLRVYRNSGIKNRYMTEERVAALNKIGMIWNVPDYIWEGYHSGM